MYLKFTILSAPFVISSLVAYYRVPIYREIPRRGNLKPRTRRSFIFIVSVPVATGIEKSGLVIPARGGQAEAK